VICIAARLNGIWRTGPLANRNFQLLAAGQFTSTVGDYCYAVALPWLVLSAHGGPVLLGAVLACYGVPRTVLIPVGGVLADKIGPRAIMLTADAVRCLMVTALVVLATQRLATLGLLGPVAALLGAGEGLFVPASFTIMPTLLGSEQLAAGNALSSAMVQGGSLIGPVLGGGLVASAGPAPAFAVDAATFAVSALTLALIRAAAASPGPQPGDATAGAVNRSASPGAGPARPEGIWSLLRRARLLQVIVVLSVAANFAYAGTFAVALPALAHARFGAGNGLPRPWKESPPDWTRRDW
jgi:MFS family permease